MVHVHVWMQCAEKILYSCLILLFAVKDKTLYYQASLKKIFHNIYLTKNSYRFVWLKGYSSRLQWYTGLQEVQPSLTHRLSTQSSVSYRVKAKLRVWAILLPFIMNPLHWPFQYNFFALLADSKSLTSSMSSNKGTWGWGRICKCYGYQNT